ncbi:MAG: hypothetical protein NTX82_03390 [Candidatus Parcubacteria bacterium]|nr:hypothetical protein [Candidatus Parcubacteria bacterium]
MKLIVVLCFLIACLMVLKKSRQFSRFLKSYEDRLPLLSEPKIFESIEDYFRVLVRIIFFWLVIAGSCVIILAWVI